MAGSLKFDRWLNDDGTENYKCRAWVNFNGTGVVSIRAAGNVSSITDNGAGDYTVNFTNAMPDANYAVTQMTGDTTTGSHNIVRSISNYSSSSFRWVVGQTGSTNDTANINVAFFR